MSDTDAENGAAPEGAATETEATGTNEVFPHLDQHAADAGPNPAREGTNINSMLNVGLDVQVILGQSRMAISQLLELSRGSVIELNKKIGAPVDLVINDRLIARGDLVKVGEDRLGVTLTEIAKDYVSDR